MPWPRGSSAVRAPGHTVCAAAANLGPREQILDNVLYGTHEIK